VGDFVYTDEEMEVMLEDIRAFKEEAVTGVVIGVLLPNGKVDIEKTRR
jgi:copper homeostasis protein